MSRIRRLRSDQHCARTSPGSIVFPSPTHQQAEHHWRGATLKRITLHRPDRGMLTVLGAIAEEERKSVSGNVKIAIRNRYKLGGSRVPTENLLSYDKAANGKIVIYEAQAKIVRKIFRLYLGGVLAEHIAGQLSSEGVPSRGKR